MCEFICLNGKLRSCAVGHIGQWRILNSRSSKNFLRTHRDERSTDLAVGVAMSGVW
jgi:hypothetical protein